MNVGWRAIQYERNTIVSYNDIDIFRLLPDGSYVQLDTPLEAEPKLPEEEIFNLLGDDGV